MAVIACMDANFWK